MNRELEGAYCWLKTPDGKHVFLGLPNEDVGKIEEGELLQLWMFGIVSGKLETGESPKDALIREAGEEYGIGLDSMTNGLPPVKINQVRNTQRVLINGVGYRAIIPENDMFLLHNQVCTAVVDSGSMERFLREQGYLLRPLVRINGEE